MNNGIMNENQQRRIEEAKAALKKFVESEEYRELDQGSWGNYLNRHPEEFVRLPAPAPPARPEQPPTPPEWGNDAKWVWDERDRRWVKGLKRFNYATNIGDWLRAQRAREGRRRSPSRSRGRYSRRRSPSRSRSRSRGRTQRRRTMRLWDEATRTYRTATPSPRSLGLPPGRTARRSRSPSRSRSRGRSPRRVRVFNERTRRYRVMSVSPPPDRRRRGSR
jgi:hypothetical protein